MAAVAATLPSPTFFPSTYKDTVPPLPSPFRRFVRATVLDSADILQDREFSAGRKLYWLVVNPFFHLAKSSAWRRAGRVRLTDTDAIARGSLEKERRSS